VPAVSEATCLGSSIPPGFIGATGFSPNEAAATPGTNGLSPENDMPDEAEKSSGFAVPHF